MAKKIIAVDADDTLFDENNAVRLFHNRVYGTNHSEHDYLAQGEFGTFWEHLWQTDVPETLRRYEEFIIYKLEHNLPPLPHALEVLALLKDKYELVVVTSRDERAITMTHEALTEHFPEVFSGVRFVPTWHEGSAITKATICNEIGATYLIDDGFHNCKLAAEAGVQTVLFGNYGWNQHQPLVPNMIRIKDWAAVREYFDGQS